MNNVMTEEGRGVGVALDVSDIPTPRALAEGKTGEAERYAEVIVGAVRAYLARGRTGTLNPKLRDGGKVPEGALARANQALAARCWKVEIDGELWTLKPTFDVERVCNEDDEAAR